MSENHIKEYVRTEFLNLSLRDLLKAPPNVLLGVSGDAEQQLQTLEIFSVFDLAASRIFNAARRLTGVRDEISDLLQIGSVPSDLVSRSIEETPLDQVQFESIEVLDGIGPNNGPLLTDALDIKTIRDLALWPAFVAARYILTNVFSPEKLPGADPEAPADLVPRSGEYPTDRSLYQTFVLIDAPDSGATDLETADPLLLSSDTAGFDKPAIGASLTYSQEWFSQGVALGQLLHSVALAPGESTRLAVIDYERRTSGAITEAVDQTERLSNSILQNRAVSEITDAVATESQEGFSKTKSKSKSDLSGEAVGGAAFVLFGGVAGQSRNNTRASTVSTSSGRRDVSTHLQQNIRNATQQNAASARSRRAATITETSLQESETISTRTVTNYNHMHALSVQYYEVVQLYRTELRLHRAEGCLFIPMKVFDFSDETVISRFREILSAAALNEIVRELLDAADGNVVISPAFTPAVTILGGTAEPEDIREAIDRAKRRAIELAKLKNAFISARVSGVLTGFRGIDEPFQMSASVRLTNIGWSDPEGRLSKIVLVSDDGFETTVTNNGNGLPAGQVNPDLGAPIALSLLREVRLEYTQDDDEPYALPIRLTFLSSGNRTSALPFDCVLPKGQSRSTLLRIHTPIAVSSVVPHLQQNALYYSQQIWLNADSHLIVMLLASFRFRDKSLIDYIDPVPVTVLGNMLGFVWHDEEDNEFAAWKKEHVNFTKIDFDLVSVPTGGVFAEAVLGRFNSAEKLDLTRFWNWQDSPIPILPTEISAIQAGQQEPFDAPQAGRLDQPIVNIVNPPSLPDPSTVAGTLNVLNNGALFRDMSGLAQTIALAQAGLQAASQGALGGASQAGTNLANVAALQGKAFDAVIAIASLLSGVPAVRPPGGANISTAGGAVNLGKDLDAIPSGGATQQAPNPLPIDPGGGGTGNGSSPSATPIPNSNGTIFASTAGSMAGAAFDALIGRTVVGRTQPGATTTPPSSTSTSTPRPTTPAQAIAEFSNRSGASPFTLGADSSAIRTAFASRLGELAADPNKFDQHGLMACGMAAFFNVWLKEDALAAVNYAIDLFEHGRGRIGSLQISPNQQLLKQDYSKLVADFINLADPNDIRIPDTAEWIMMSSLRNSTPARLSPFSYLGRPAPRPGDNESLRAQTQDLEGVVFPDELTTWLTATGIYSDVVNKANPAIRQDFSVSQTLFPDANRNVVMLINTQMLIVGPPGGPCNAATSDLGEILLAIAIPNHYVVLEKHIDPPVDGNLSLTFWCWADVLRNCMPYTVDIDTFKANFYGAVIGVK
jgi:hypothetical protein